jgi:hypothetical protein
MINAKKVVISIILFCSWQIGKTQKETNNWFFGYYAGLSFNTTPPSILTSNSLLMFEGSSSISDPDGNLLFYTDGETVKNKSHQTMANGTGLIGHSSTSQSSIIIKKPGNNKLYYLITLGQGTAKLGYSIIDMSLAAGMGSVTTKNIILADSCDERLTAVKHCNGVDTWVVVHRSIYDDYLAFKVGASVNSSPVISSLGGWLFWNVNQGCMKLSPTGKKIGFAGWSIGPIGIADFDAATGVLSNPLIFGTSFHYSYGCEFSPDGTKFYSSADNYVLQWDLCAGSDSAIAASQATVGSNTATTTNQPFGSMQLAPNGKIYLIDETNYSSLAVINLPNSKGITCNYQPAAQSIAPKGSKLGLPNFVSSYFKQLPAPITYTQNSNQCKVVSFTAPQIPIGSPSCAAMADGYLGFKWIFGDIQSGGTNTSTASNPTHTFSSSGVFKTNLVLFGTCGNDTITKTVSIGCVGINEINLDSGLNFYPNPVERNLTIVSDRYGWFEIIDWSGEIVISSPLDVGRNDCFLSYLPAGIYVLRSNVTKTIYKILKSD